jgi:WD40 repeat protein
MKYFIFSCFLLLFTTGIFAQDNSGQINHPQSSINAHHGWITAMVLSPDGKNLISAGRDSDVKIWSISDHALKMKFAGHHSEVFGLAISPDGKLIASADYDHHIIVWDKQTGKIIINHTFPSYSTALGFLQNDILVAGFQNGDLIKLNAVNGDIIKKVSFDYGINSLSISADHQKIVTGGPLMMWTADSLKQVKMVTPLGGIFCVSFSKDGNFFASTHTQGKAFCWKTEILDSVRSYPYLDSLYISRLGSTSKIEGMFPVISAAFSNDNNLIATGGIGNEIRVFDRVSGMLKSKYAGHTKMVTGILFSGSGSQMISCSEDGTIRFWDYK